MDGNFDLTLTAILIWAVGAAAFLIWQAVRQRRFIRSLLANSTSPAPQTLACAAEAASACGLKSAPLTRVSGDNSGPLVSGLFRPLIILPADFESVYSTDERRLALAHECAHIARGDLLATLAALVFRAAQWPNPLAHFAFNAFRTDQEAACDASVIARHAATPDVSYVYGAAIVKSATGRIAPAANLAMSQHLKERLMQMKSGKKSSTAIGRVIAAVLVAGGLAATASYSYAAEKDAKKEVRVVKTDKKASSINVISVDDGEALELAGVDGAGKIEIRNEDGARTVKIWDKSGALVSEKTYGPEDDMPHKTIIVVGADGKRKTIKIGEEPGHPEWIDELANIDGPENFERKIVIMKHGDDIESGHDPDCEPMEVADESQSADGERRVVKQVLCIKGADSKDPAARAAALKKAIGHMEASAAKEAEHRQKMLAKLREQLAAAEKEAAKKDSR